MGTFIISMVAFFVGCIVGVFGIGMLKYSNAPEDDRPSYPKCKDYKNNEYEILEFDALNAGDLSHMVIYRSTYGHKLVWVRPKKEFYGSVDLGKNGGIVDRFTIY